MKKPAYRRKAKTKKAKKKRASYYEGIRWIAQDPDNRLIAAEMLSLIFGKDLKDVRYTLDQYCTEWRLNKYLEQVWKEDTNSDTMST